MIKSFGGINISSKNPKMLVEFYNEKLGIPILTEDPNKNDYDGCELGFSKSEPVIWIWNETKWGKSNFGALTLVFRCDNITDTYYQLKQNGINLEQPTTASWGGRELTCKDLEGNIILILE